MAPRQRTPLPETSAFGPVGVEEGHRRTSGSALIQNQTISSDARMAIADGPSHLNYGVWWHLWCLHEQEVVAVRVRLYEVNWHEMR